jgi:uncharacterized membrane protein
VTVAAHHYHPVRPGPLHALLLGGSVPLFIGGLLSDIAYYQTYHIQWANFAAWLIAGALLLSGLALLFALVNLIRAERKGGRPAAYFLLLLLAWVLGLVNAFEHAKDAWAVMPNGLILSVVVTVLSLAAAWIGLSNLRSEVTR